MRRNHLLIAAAVLLLPLLAPVASGGDADPTGGAPSASAFFPVSAVRPGMKGYGLTVKAGTKIERFEVEVVDVMTNFLAKQDLILVRCLGEEFEDHRIAQGMSGSPVYFDDKVAGAVAYAWGFQKHALAGVTPIEAMVAEGVRPLEGRPSGAEPPTGIRREASAAGGASAGAGLTPIGTPLCVSGFSEGPRELLAREMEPRGLLLRVGGGEGGGTPGDWVDRDVALSPGSTIMVELLRGDVNAAALGTCTWVDGEKVFGFGHPFDSLGETRLPMSTGHVYTVVSSTSFSFKMGSALRQVGAIVQDRQSCIHGILGAEAPMIPFELRFVNGVTQRTEDFRFEVTANRVYLQPMMLVALGEAFARAETTFGTNTKRYRMTVKIRGLDEPWSYGDVIAGFDAGLQRVLIGLVDRLMIHPTQRAELEWVKLDVDIEHRDRRASIEAASASVDETKPGEEVAVRVRLRHRDGGTSSVETFPVRIPRDAPAGPFTFTVTTGDAVGADVPEPVAIADLPTLTRGFYKATEIVAVLPTDRVDLDMNGRLIHDLPLSSVPRLARSPEGKGITLRPVTEKVRHDTEFVVEGGKRVTVLVRR
jgi:hypothetical protein